jgi:isopentenyldiphosphate isomerase
MVTKYRNIDGGILDNEHQGENSSRRADQQSPELLSFAVVKDQIGQTSKKRENILEHVPEKQKEIFDIVNEEDEVIAQLSREETHALGKRHRSISILVFKDVSRQEVLIQKRSQMVDNSAGKKSLTEGHLHAGETYESGAFRELQEELFDGKPVPSTITLEKLFKIRKTEDNDPEFKTIYRTIYDSSFSLDAQEVESVQFEGIEKILADVDSHPENYSETFIRVMKEYKKRFLDKKTQ